MPINLKIVNVASGEEAEGRFRSRVRVRMVKIRGMLMLGIRPIRPGKYELATEEAGEALGGRTKISDLGLADGATLYLREAGSVMNVTYVCSANGTECEEPCLADDVLGEVEMRVLPDLGISLEDKDLWGVSLTEGGDPLDETQTLADLGIGDGHRLYTVGQAQMSITWLNCTNGASCTDAYGASLTLGEAKNLTLAALGIPPGDGASYAAGLTPGSALDESQTLDALGIADGAFIYVWLA